jgi:hypothetical protein
MSPGLPKKRGIGLKGQLMASLLILLAIQLDHHYDAHQRKQRNDQPLDPQKKVAGHA